MQRINHLEALSGQFPKGYDLTVIPIWSLETKGKYDFDLEKAVYSIYYRRKNNPVKILDGDYTSDFEVITEIEKLLSTSKQLDTEAVIKYMRKK